MVYLKLIIALVGIISSFFFFHKGISENTIHKMVQSDFTIETRYCGCFGCGSETITAYKVGDKRWLKITSPDHEARRIEFTREKEKQLESIIKKIAGKTTTGYCTTDAEYVFENNGFRFKIYDGSCSLRRVFE